MSEPPDTLVVSSSEAGGPPGEALAPLPRGTALGRYIVLSRLGAGGAGVVYSAFDPELDRTVALKLLHRTSQDVIAEARSLAKLSHPNVVAIHDVGQFGAHVYLAMEFVRGQSLAAWSDEAPRGWRQVVDVFLAAGHGLAAAHEVGLVHRDFKPSNVMIDAELRVRVMDFGIVAGPDASGGGTQAYMAPEQRLALEVGAAADQFSFCVTLWEALYGERPSASPPPRERSVPKWLRRLCERGLSTDPAQRFGSMAELLTVLARGQATARTRRVVAGAAALALVVAAAEGWRRDAAVRDAADCRASGDAIEEVWNDDARQRIHTALAESGMEESRAAATVTPWIDQQAASWREQRTRACVKRKVEGTWTEATRARVVSCLQARRSELGATVTRLGEADRDLTPVAVNAAASLTPVSLCSDAAVLAKLPPPPPADHAGAVAEIEEALARAKAHQLVADYAAGLTVVDEALSRISGRVWPRLHARLLHRQASLLSRLGDPERAASVGDTSYAMAARAGAWGTAAAVAAFLAFEVGVVLGRIKDGRRWVRHARVAASHAADPLRLREAQRAGTLASLQDRAGESQESLASGKHAVDLLERALGRRHPRTLWAISNVSLAYYRLGDYPRAAEMFEQLRSLEVDVLGPDHLAVSNTISNTAMVRFAQRDYAAAGALHEEALALRERKLGAEHLDVGSSLNNLAIVRRTQGELEEAAALLQRALRIFEGALGPNSRQVAIVLEVTATVQQDLEQFDAAKASFERGLAILEATAGPDHPWVASNLYNTAGLLHVLGEHTQAVALLERSVAIYDAHEGEQINEPEARFRLAEAIVQVGGDGARAVAQARLALESFRSTGPGAGDQVAKIDHFIATQTKPAD